MSELQKVRELIEVFRLLDSSMPMSRAALLVDLLMSEEIDRRDIELRLGISDASVTRNLQSLESGIPGKTKAGINMIRFLDDPEDGRMVRIEKTKRAKWLEEKLKAILSSSD